MASPAGVHSCLQECNFRQNANAVLPFLFILPADNTCARRGAPPAPGHSATHVVSREQPQQQPKMPTPPLQPLLSPQRLREQLRMFESSSPLLKVRLHASICNARMHPRQAMSPHCAGHCRATPRKRYKPPRVLLRQRAWRWRGLRLVSMRSTALPNRPKRCRTNRLQQQSSRSCLRLRPRKGACSVIRRNRLQCRPRRSLQPMQLLQRRRIHPYIRPSTQRRHRLRKRLSENHLGLKNRQAHDKSAGMHIN